MNYFCIRKILGNDYKNPEFKHYYPNKKLANSEIHLEQPVRSVLKDKDNDEEWILSVSKGKLVLTPNNKKAKQFELEGLNYLRVGNWQLSYTFFYGC